MTAAAVGEAPTGASTRPPKLPSLTGLRFFAALFVFLYHFAQLLGPYPPHGPVTPFADPSATSDFAAVVANGGFVGVSFFFVLSGFVLTWSAVPGERGTAFVRRRLLKIYPTHLATFAIAMLLFAAAYTPATVWLKNVLLLHSFSSDPSTFMSVNAPSWSLCCELLFYLLFPFVIGPVRRIADNRLWAWAGAMVAGTVGVALVTQYLVTSTPRTPFIPDLSMTQFWSAYYFPPARLFEFALGMVLARIVRAGRWPRIPMTAAVALMAAGYVLSLHVPFFYRFEVAMVIPISVVICSFAAADARGGRTPVSGRAMQWLGERSFGFYMAQGIVLLYGRTLIGHNARYDTPTAIAVLIGFILANLVAGTLLHVCVERPVMRRWARGPQRARTPSVDVRPSEREVIR
ncbi:acyltransferase [Kitasatospora sp. SUK 42]|uniref:acyltransferase family protein n=1 Tax=Kitasatospora sp. SUK 42 TaxID=1588882 RepID=UPI0018CA4BFD|nr:acyltransferase [Kitasatospora sp. SUK 42]MBV2156622.1 acyltransferase [Kitasatospora sp. SUK 42]